MPIEPGDSAAAYLVEEGERAQARELERQNKLRGRKIKRVKKLEQKIIESDDLVNSAGLIKLSADGMRSLLVAAKLYGGESLSFVVDRILRRQYINKVPSVVVLPAPIYKEAEKVARERGYRDAEHMFEESLIAAFKPAMGVHGRKL